MANGPIDGSKVFRVDVVVHRNHHFAKIVAKPLSDRNTTLIELCPGLIVVSFDCCGGLLIELV